VLKKCRKNANESPQPLDGNCSVKCGINAVVEAIGETTALLSLNRFSIEMIDPPLRFDMMGKRLYKTYVDLTNIVIRISDGTPAGKEHAILVNSHVDSTLPSPGAADDGLAVGVMLDCMRVLINSPDWSPRHAIVLRKLIPAQRMILVS
jgi:Zn-dependent M28 family amino/carboxypeptidase